MKSFGLPKAYPLIPRLKILFFNQPEPPPSDFADADAENKLFVFERVCQTAVFQLFDVRPRDIFERRVEFDGDAGDAP